jgi:hypothetical protein
MKIMNEVNVPNVPQNILDIRQTLIDRVEKLNPGEHKTKLKIEIMTKIDKALSDS